MIRERSRRSFLVDLKRFLDSTEPVAMERLKCNEQVSFGAWANPLVDQALQWQLNAEDCVARYVHYGLLWGKGWIDKEDWQWAAVILGDPSLNQWEKLAAIDELYFGCIVIPQPRRT